MSSTGDFVGSGPRMLAIRHFVEMYARGTSPVAVIGEEGTGCRFIARLIREAGASVERAILTASPGVSGSSCLRIVLPPLRTRREDIAALTDLFLMQTSAGPAPRLVSPSARHALVTYDWPGNLRELRETCEWISRTCTCQWIKRGCLPARLQRAVSPALPDTARCAGLDAQLRELEVKLITGALIESGHNRSRAARLLQIKRSTLGDRIQRLGLSGMEEDVA